MPGHVFHNNPILAEYAKVLVQEITDMRYTDYLLDHVTLEGVNELGQAVNQFILWNRSKIFLDRPISPQKQRIQLSQTPTSSPVEHALATPSGQQASQQLTSPHSEQEAPQQPLQLSPKVKEALQLPSPPTDTKATKDKEASAI
jgi:hypothetical protein